MLVGFFAVQYTCCYHRTELSTKLRFLKSSIAYRYLGIATLFLVSVQLSLGFWQSRWHYSRQLNGLEQRLENKADFLSAVSVESIFSLDFLDLENLMKQTSEDTDIVYSIILDSQGQPLTRFLNREHPLIATTIPQEDLSNNTLDIIKQINKDSAVNLIKKNIIYQDRLLGEVWLGYTYKNIQKEFYRAATLNLVNAILASILLAGITLIIFKKQVGNPLKKLAKLSQEIADGELNKRVNIVDRDNEIGLLEASFNKMAVQLQETIEGLHKNNEDLAITNAKLARATKLKDEFLASMSHELRTPLNAVLGLSEALLEEVYGSLTERQKRSLTTINNSGQHLLALINDILDLAKIESGEEKLNLACVELPSLCNASLEFVREQANKKNIQLEADIAAVLGCVELDERRIKQVLINLLTNAVKFTFDGGKVSLKAWGDTQEEQIIFQVIDTGIGIKPEDMDKLFQSFVQIESSLSRRYEGTGLGLALVKNIIELHGGSISVKSEIAKGSEFTIILPWRKLTEPNSELDITNETTTLVTNYSSALILLAEDNEANILMMSDYLISKGYQLIFAHNGFEAVNLAKDKHPDLILMDIQMPDMDGLEATRRIKQDSSLAKIPIIALTALTMPGDREKCFAAGVNEYLTKPVNLKKLVNSIEQQLAKKQNSKLLVN